MRVLCVVVGAVVAFGCSPPPNPSGTGGGVASVGGGFAGVGGGSAGGSASAGGRSTAGGSATAGGMATAGGSAAAGGAASAGGVGGGGTGGGTASTGGVGTFVRVGFYNQYLAAGPDGSMHLTFLDGAAERAYYAHCDTRCGDPASWSPVLLRTNAQLGLITIGPYGIGVDASGRVHLLLSGVTPSGQTANALVYATCASGCSNAASWTFLDVSSLSTGRSAVSTERPFMVEPSGRVSFFTSDPGVYFACTSGCTTLSNWSANVSLNGNPLHAAVDGAGVTHVLLRQGSSAANEKLLKYARCASNCTMPASWAISSLGFLHNSNDYSASLTVTTSGRVFMAWNQGVITVSTADNRKLQVASCAGSGCMDLNTWASFTIGALDEGTEGAFLEASGESVALASVSEFDLNLRACDQNCQLPASWSAAGVIDNAASMNQALPPDTGTSCSGSSQSASWWPSSPSVGISARGVVVVHNPYGIVKCPSSVNPMRVPPIGRVISTF